MAKGDLANSAKLGMRGVGHDDHPVGGFVRSATRKSSRWKPAMTVSPRETNRADTFQTHTNSKREDKEISQFFTTKKVAAGCEMSECSQSVFFVDVNGTKVALVGREVFA